MEKTFGQASQTKFSNHTAKNAAFIRFCPTAQMVLISRTE